MAALRRVSPDPGGSKVDDLTTGMIRVSLLVRQVALAAAAAATFMGDTTLLSVLVVVALAVTSQVGLRSVRVLRLVERHPAVALVDVLLVATAMMLMGPRHPVVLAALTSALIIGVLFRLSVAPLLVVLLLAGHAVSLRVISDPTLDDVFGMPVVIVSIAAVGVGFRRVSERARRTDLQAAQARQELATAQERVRLARDVHDTVAKSVQGVALLAASLPAWIERDSARAVVQADLVAATARDAVTEARSLLTQLRVVPEESRLENWLVDRLDGWSSERTGALTADLAPLPALDPLVSQELRAALGEALENIDRHAPGSAVRVQVRVEGDTLVAVVSDDGPGFDQARRRAAVAEDHYGLVGIQERMASVGGVGAVTSAPGRGTTVRLTVPVRVPAERSVGPDGRATAPLGTAGRVDDLGLRVVS